ncbi:hypothetical protein A2853_02725 [Candidatus Kaiserbacteria bacterium RIFCSPHIGHO2_01_FULL_55_17]|uniref:Uncharacterized protein n=1 Tax=Candidatus Kaiserbacteria bacterium RIFCSPHIGHO2_01_FULL_55_17 TaxID=1798484 RepID=A0A1F6D811_9BACT|nr:MAG: hypothetical protein A2853_02725 [Candidatus Kaiserbacteria bacterium RIFCSPHIGHO2_01_FULL_55_17]
MLRTAFGLVIVILVIAAGVYFLGTPRAEAPTTDEYGWQLVQFPENAESDIPRATVNLRAGETKHALGEFDGVCFVIEELQWELLENEKTGVICWWAGSGKEIGIFTEDGRDVVKVGELDEGLSDDIGFRGNFETILEL